MTIENLRAACNVTPFQPFILHMADGRQLPVPSREFLLIPPGGRTVVLWQSDESIHIIDMLLVTDWK